MTPEEVEQLLIEWGEVGDAPDIFIPLYVGDYLSATTDLTVDEHGAYLLLILNLWRRGGYLANDTKRLARMVGVTPKRFSKIFLKISAYFFHFSSAKHGEIICNERVLKVMREKLEKTLKARNSAQFRWDAEKSLNANALPKHIRNGMRNVCYSESESELTHTLTRERDFSPPTKEAAIAFAAVAFPKADAGRFWDHWQALGWTDSKGAPVDWKAKLAWWVLDGRGRSKTAPASNGKPAAAISRTPEELEAQKREEVANAAAERQREEASARRIAIETLAEDGIANPTEEQIAKRVDDMDVKFWCLRHGGFDHIFK